MRRAQGIMIVVGDEEVHRDTFTCPHCERIVIVQPFEDPSVKSGFCLKCYRHTCRWCAQTDCVPWEKVMEKMEARDRLLRACGVA